MLKKCARCGELRHVAGSVYCNECYKKIYKEVDAKYAAEKRRETQWENTSYNLGTAIKQLQHEVAKLKKELHAYLHSL